MAKGIKLISILSLVLSAIGVIFGGLIYGYEVRTVVLFGLMGAFLGGIAAPVVEPKYFKNPVIWQIIFAVIGCSLFAFSINASVTGHAVAVITGLILGATARYWIKYASFP